MDPNAELVTIANAALASVDPRQIVRRTMRIDGPLLRLQAPGADLSFDLRRFERIMVLGFGKASAPMAQAAEEALGERLAGGLIVVKPGHELPLARIRQVHGAHPVPDDTSVEAAARLAAAADGADGRTLAIVLISGGGSSLIAAPLEGHGVTLADIQETTRRLLACGAEIAETNCIRKHLLLLAGGRLAERLSPAVTVGIVLSDVVGDDIATIASGPLCGDETTYADALSIVRQYGIEGSLPASVMAFLRAGAAGDVPETAKPGEPAVAEARAVLAGSNMQALQAAAGAARGSGYRALILSSHVAGEAREVARVLAGVAKDAARDPSLMGGERGKPVCILCGGETTVTLRGKGRGGRNQEMALAFLREMQKDPRGLARARLLSFSTDGEDGPTDAAGGFAHPRMLELARARGIGLSDALRENDSHTALAALDGLFVTGPTNTNVCDVQILLVEP